MQVQLRKEQTRTCKLKFGKEPSKSFRVVVKDALMARQCASCGSFFQMQGGERDFGTWNARMSGCPGRLGNIFLLCCCSFKCAHNLEEGGWAEPVVDDSDYSFVKDEARQYAEAGCTTVHVEFAISEIQYEDDLIKEWEARPDLNFKIRPEPCPM